MMDWRIASSASEAGCRHCVRARNMYSSRPLGLAEDSEDLSAGGILMHGEMHGEMHGCLRHSRSTETHRSYKMPLGTQNSLRISSTFYHN